MRAPDAAVACDRVPRGAEEFGSSRPYRDPVDWKRGLRWVLAGSVRRLEWAERVHRLSRASKLQIGDDEVHVLLLRSAWPIQLLDGDDGAA